MTAQKSQSGKFWVVHFGPRVFQGSKDGRGDFYGNDTLGGRSILVRNSFSGITPNSSRFEQAFSDDGGKTWETNWVMTFTR